MEISTSILDSDNRVDSVIRLNHTNTSYIHVDVMDGRFVSNKAFSTVEEIREIHEVSNCGLDVHLMVDDPIKYIEKLRDMNILYITIHLELEVNIFWVIDKIKECGYKVGLAIKPNTDIDKIIPYLEFIDLVLVMSVEPGMGGQKFLSSTIYRVNELKKIILERRYDVVIEVDGGINLDTIQELENVDIFVVGSYIMKSRDYSLAIDNLLSVI